MVRRFRLQVIPGRSSTDHDITEEDSARDASSEHVAVAESDWQ